MAQIIKHRRGSIDSLKGSLARKGELVIATGSIGNMNGPWVFVGDNDANGAYKPTSQIYRGNTAPTISNLTYGSTLDGTPFYSITSKSLYILDSTGNAQLDLSGNIEGNTISGVTINNLQSTNVTASYISGAFIGDATGLYNIPASGVTGLNLSKIYSGSVQVSTDSDAGTITLSGGTVNILNDTNIVGSTIYLNEVSGYDGGHVNIYSTDYAQLNWDNTNYIWLQNDGAWIETNGSDIHLTSVSGQTIINTSTNTGDVHIGSGINQIYLSGNTHEYGTFSIDDTFQMYHDGAMFLEDNDGTGIEIQSTNYTKLKQNDNSAYFYTSQNYAEMYGNTGLDVFTNSGNLWVYNNSGNINISSYDGSTLYLNTDGGEGDVNLGNNSNSVWGYTSVTNFAASDYAQLGSNESYLFVRADGAYLQNASGSVAGFTARQNGILEATGSLNIYGNTQISGNTSVTGALVVSNGSATFDQGLVAQNSNMLLTSGSNLIIQDGGNLQIAGNAYITGSGYVDTVFGKTNTNNYLAFNGGAAGAPDVELESQGNISLWAEGGLTNVTGALKVTGDVTVESNLYVSGNIYQTGSYFTQGNVTFSGSISLGDSLTGDTINFGGEVNSNIIPTTGATYDLGSSGKTWNNIWGENAHFTNINIGSIELNSLALPGDLTVSGSTQLSGSVGVSSLTEGRIVTVGANGTLVDSDHFNWNTGSNQLGISGSIKLNDDAYIYNDGALYIQDHTYGVEVGSNNYAQLTSNSSYMKVDSSDSAYVVGNSYTQIKSNYGRVDISSYDGYQLRLNYDGGEGNIRMGNGDNNVQIYSHTYINNNKTLYVNRMWDNSDNSNYLELYGYGTNNGYWWESNSGADTTLNNNWGGAHTNILNTNNGNVNIDATNGSVNIHSNNGTNITGSLTVSDGSGLFNSYLIANNSNLTLENGSNLEILDNGTLLVTGQGDFNNNVYVSGNTYSDQYRGLSDNTNVLYMNGGGLSPDVELASHGQISLWAEGNNGNSGIHLTGSVYSNNHMYINNGNRLYTNYISDNNGEDLNINTDGGIYLYSDATREIQLSTNNAESGTNYINVNNNNVYLSTYDFTSGLTHKVTLDNTGSLKLENVAFQLSGSLNVDGNSIFNHDLTVGGNMYVSGNFQVLGTGSIITLTGSQIDIGTNRIALNTYAPFERFAGIDVYDSGSNVGVTGSLLWDSLNDVWIYANPSGSNYASARFIAGPKNTGSLGEETGLTEGHFPIATGDDHISDSLLTYQGTTFALNTNKFTVDSNSGDTLIQGNFTIQGAGAADNGDWSSYLVFRNSDNVLGFVDTTDTGNITEGLLGYNASSGVLEFSSLIDGGTY